MKTTLFIIIISFCCHYCFADQAIVAAKVSEAPVIDGAGNDVVWRGAGSIITHDKVADIDVALKAVYTGREIFILVEYPDSDESREHKSWVWDKEMEVYRIGPAREDSFVLKWSMEPGPVDLSVYSDDNYKADIWFWKASRTDPSGFADDKMHIYGESEQKHSADMTSRLGYSKYLSRPADKGRAAFEDLVYIEYEGDVMPHFKKGQPTGSRADVRAKGQWAGGKWTIEFARLLDTENEDDIIFDIEKEYLFGISKFEIAGRGEDPKSDMPLYGTGDVSERLILQFDKK